MASGFASYVISAHAAAQARRRGIPLDLVEHIMREPDQRYPVSASRDAVQSRAELGAKVYLVRVIVDVGQYPVEVITVYRTSRISKYWRVNEGDL